MAKEGQRCKGTTKAGEPCTVPIAGPNGFCFRHDPSKVEESREASARGGHNRSNVARLRAAAPARLAAVYDRLEDALIAVENGTLQPGQASAMASLARAMATIMQVGELEMRIKELEQGVISSHDWRIR